LGVAESEDQWNRFQRTKLLRCV